MHLYRLANYKTLVGILVQLCCLVLISQQFSLQKRSPNEGQDLAQANSHQEDSSSQTIERKSPLSISRTRSTHDETGPAYVVLMSSDTISLAQLPMIIYGNVTDVYTLSQEDKNRHQDVEIDLEREDNNERNQEEEEEEEDAKSFEDPQEPTENELKEARKKQHHDNSSSPTKTANADAREYEQQMPHMTTGVNTTTTTSLGKSEWQQIANVAAQEGGGPNREEVSVPQQQTSNRKKSAQDGGKEDEAQTTGPRRRRRRRRSNSLSDYEDDSGNRANADQSVSRATTSIANNYAQTLSKATPEESNMQNVTSASFQTSTSSEQQPNLASLQGGSATSPAEESDKIGRSLETSDSVAGPRAAMLTVTSSFSSASSSSNGVHFSDFDVHMALGYAFVADSAGRIHRIKLPTGAVPAAAERRQRARGAQASGDRNRDRPWSWDSTTSDNDDTANTIDAAGSSSKVVDDYAMNGGHNSTTRAFDSDAASDGYTNRIQLEHSYDANRVRSMQQSGSSSGAVTHEQFENNNERQHPSISGRSSEPSRRVDSSAASGAASLDQQQRFYVENAYYVGGVKPKIIWSRNKYSRAAGPLAKVEISVGGASSAKQKERQLANDDEDERRPGALSLPADSAQSSSSTTSGRPHSLAGEKQSFGTMRASKQRRRQTLPTELAVDWLNNLLFVLDKCRLLVMDLEGNNELVLIDDFSANNRPIDIKVDPINDFLFWLQIGKFHNTIYKLDLSVLSMPSATQKLVSNALRLRQSTQQQQQQVNSNSSENGFDASDLVPLVSHHYAHPIITNLPRNTRIFTIDHKHSRIYVPLSPHVVGSSAAEDLNKPAADAAGGNQRDDAEVFAPTDDVTHLNSSQIAESAQFEINCNQSDSSVFVSPSEGQILAYNLDGTDVGPLRMMKSHISSSLDDVQDLTLNNEEGLLYWLTNDGRDLFEEFRENSSTIQPVSNYLDGRSYSKLIYFDTNQNNSNQPTSQRARHNVRKIIHMLSASISPYRHIRDSVPSGDGMGGEDSSAISLSVRQSEQFGASQASRNVPYIILGVTCLFVTTVYLMYALIFQRIQQRHSNNGAQCHHSADAGDGSISGGSSIGSGSGGLSHDANDNNSNGFVNSSTISRWVAGPSARSAETSTFNRDINSFNGQLGAYDLESTNYGASNAIDEHYRGSTIDEHNATGETQQRMFPPDVKRLANISEWPSNMHDLSNKLYVPVEVLQDEALASIRRVSIDQLEIERKAAPLGEGHFGTVLQGTIKCTEHEKDYLLDQSRMLMTPGYGPISPDSLAPPSRTQMFAAPSTSSSGHGSSSSTSCEFVAANTCTESTTSASHDDYLTPKTQLNSTSSDYGVEMPTGSSQVDSLSGYCGALGSPRPGNSTLASTKLRVAIKKLKDNASPEEKRDFLQEAKLLANFDHPNIVHLIGICLDRGSTLIVMELMLGGDLIRYMQENTPNQINNYADSNLTYDDLLKICLDIANGCCYLEDMDYIHRDLAARNCLVSSRKREERVVKLADFGLARDIYKDSYYKKLNDSAMPLKWMAPECLIEQKFTKKSDVWSFGVVMWEVMSYCQEKPYSGVEPFFMKEHLASGARLRKPASCDESMYRLMNQCWLMKPKERPTFHECRAMLIEIRNSGKL